MCTYNDFKGYPHLAGWASNGFSQNWHVQKTNNVSHRSTIQRKKKKGRFTQRRKETDKENKSEVC